MGADCFQQHLADLDDGGVADAEMFLRAVGDRAHRFLDRAVLNGEPEQAGKAGAAGLLLSVDAVIVVAVEYRAVGAGDVLGMDMQMAFR